MKLIHFDLQPWVCGKVLDRFYPPGFAHNVLRADDKGALRWRRGHKKSLRGNKDAPAPLERTTLRLAFATAERAATIKQLLEEAKTRQMSTSV